MRGEYVQVSNGTFDLRSLIKDFVIKGLSRHMKTKCCQSRNGEKSKNQLAGSMRRKN